MAVSNNLGMYLPTRDDYISVKRDISDNLALIDAAAGNMDIIVNGNTASVNVTSGQFVTVLNSTITGVTDGIYKAVANVAAGVPFVAANLTSPTSGALNELVEQIANVPSVVNLSTNLTIDHADSATIGYRTTDSTKVALSSLQGFPTGKTVVCAYPHAYDDIYGRVLWVDNSLNLRGVSKYSCTISVTITVFYK